MTDFRTHVRNKFHIPEAAQAAIAEWQKTLPISKPGVNWEGRYVYSFVDNGLVDEITVKDITSGKTLTWAPSLEDW